MNRKNIIHGGFIVMVFGILFCQPVFANTVSELDFSTIDKSQEYHVTYQEHDQGSVTVLAASIQKLVKINGIVFLVIEGKGFKDMKGYIRLDTIKSILPLKIQNKP